MNKDAKELVAIAAAVAGKCQPCFDYHYKLAKELGFDDQTLQEVMQLAQDIRASGDKHMDEFAVRRMNISNEEGTT